MALTSQILHKPTHWLHDLCLEVLTVHGDKLLLSGKASLPHIYQYLFRKFDIAAIGIIFKVFSFNAVLDEIESITFPTPCYTTVADYTL